jgi:hypothetical protein
MRWKKTIDEKTETSTENSSRKMELYKKNALVS